MNTYRVLLGDGASEDVKADRWRYTRDNMTTAASAGVELVVGSEVVAMFSAPVGVMKLDEPGGASNPAPDDDSYRERLREQILDDVSENIAGSADELVKLIERWRRRQRRRGGPSPTGEWAAP